LEGGNDFFKQSFEDINKHRTIIQLKLKVFSLPFFQQNSCQVVQLNAALQKAQTISVLSI